MAAQTILEKRYLTQIADDYGFGKAQGMVVVPAGSINTHYRLDTAKGRYFLRLDEEKSEMEVKRELDLLLYLRKHGFPCPQLIADRKGRQYRELHEVLIFRVMGTTGERATTHLFEVLNAVAAIPRANCPRH